MQGADTAHGDNFWTEYRELLHLNPPVQTAEEWSKILKFIPCYFAENTKMRPLTDEETKIFFEKLSKYIGDNVKLLIDRADGAYCFRYTFDNFLLDSNEIFDLHFWVK